MFSNFGCLSSNVDLEATIFSNKLHFDRYVYPYMPCSPLVSLCRWVVPRCMCVCYLSQSLLIVEHTHWRQCSLRSSWFSVRTCLAAFRPDVLVILWYKCLHEDFIQIENSEFAAGEKYVHKGQLPIVYYTVSLWELPEIPGGETHLVFRFTIRLVWCNLYTNYCIDKLQRSTNST